MTRAEAFSDVFGPADLLTSYELADAVACEEDALRLSPAARDTLRQIHNTGPVWDGDLVSKRGRDELIDADAAVKVVVQGEQGYQACTYRGRDMMRLFDAMEDKIS